MDPQNARSRRTREALLRAAWELVESDGVGKLTMATVAAAPAQVVGAAVADGADAAGGRVGAVGVELGGLAAVRAAHAGALVAVFFRARCCS